MQPNKNKTTGPAQLGRPPDRSQAIADEICERLAGGESLRSICSAPGVLDKSNVLRWINDDEAFRDQYARARVQQIQNEMDALLELADEQPSLLVAEDGSSRVDGAWVALLKLRLDTRRWVASKLLPKVYADQSASTQINLGVAVAVAMPEARRAKIMALRRASQVAKCAQAEPQRAS